MFQPPSTFPASQPFQTTGMWLKIPDSVFAEHPVVFSLILILSLMYFTVIRVESLRGARHPRRSRDNDEPAAAQWAALIKPWRFSRVSCDTSFHRKMPRGQPQSIIKPRPFLIAKLIPQLQQSPHMWHVRKNNVLSVSSKTKT